MREITTIAECAEWTNEAGRKPAVFRGLPLADLRGFENGRFDDCLFLSCDMTPAQAGFVTIMGGTVIRDDGSYPYDLHRTELYTPDELFAGFVPSDPNGYAHTFDAVVYRHWTATGGQHPPSLAEGLARRLHDFSITDALHEQLVGREPVAIMGGHGLERSSDLYRDVAEISRTLSRAGKLMLSGGGPGAMEATHLGAWFAHRDDGDLDAAIEVLSPRPLGAEAGREYADADWLHRAVAVAERWPLAGGLSDPVDSIGIPTWVYGHEPPAAFATRVAKYFANSIREEGLLAVATSGVIFSPGSAGTIQEIFQDAAQNHYSSFGPPSPMVLFGVDYWTEQFPVWPVLDALSKDRDYRDLMLLTDSVDEAVSFTMAHRREPVGGVR